MSAPKNMESLKLKCIELKYIQHENPQLGYVVELSLNRPESSNALSYEMMVEIIQVLKNLNEDSNCRCLILKAKGKNFCAGADLNWMRKSAKLSYQENLKDAKILTKLFDSLYQFMHPTIGVAHGAAYGGAVGLLACCDIVVAEPSTVFSLSEVKLGLGPAVIFPYLMRRIQAGALRRISLSAKTFGVREALTWGLVDVESLPNETGLEKSTWDELKRVLMCSPNAQREIKKLHRIVMDHSSKQMDICSQSIANLRTSEEAQKGLESFFEKKLPPWSSGLNGDGWSYESHSP